MLFRSQGGLAKAFDFASAVGEMQHFGLHPAAPMAAAVIALELLAPAAILTGRWRWAGALALGVFTLAASVVANPFWALAGMERFAATNAFFEHIGLAGGFALVCWHDLRRDGAERRA